MSTNIKKRPVIGISLSLAHGNRLQTELAHDGLVNENKEHLYLKAKLCKSVWNAGGLPILLSPSPEPKNYLNIIDGLLIPGGDDIPPAFYGGVPDIVAAAELPEKIESDIKLINNAKEKKISTLGICLGMQTMNVALGGNLIQDIPAEVKNHLPHGLPNYVNYHDVIVKGGSLLQNLLKLNGNKIHVSTSHHQSVKELGKELLITAKTADGVIEGIELDKSKHPFFLGVQWHPEWDNTESLLIGALVRSCQ